MPNEPDSKPQPPPQKDPPSPPPRDRPNYDSDLVKGERPEQTRRDRG